MHKTFLGATSVAKPAPTPAAPAPTTGPSPVPRNRSKSPPAEEVPSILLAQSEPTSATAAAALLIAQAEAAAQAQSQATLALDSAVLANNSIGTCGQMIQKVMFSLSRVQSSSVRRRRGGLHPERTVGVVGVVWHYRRQVRKGRALETALQFDSARVQPHVFPASCGRLSWYQDHNRSTWSINTLF